MGIEINKISGLVAATFAPMKANGDLNPDLIPLYFDLLKVNNINGVFVNGTTGEGVSLSMAEKKEITETWAGVGNKCGGMKIINHVGGTCARECVELAVFSRLVGFNAIALSAPYYLRPAKVTDLLSFIAEIACEVPDMPVYYYHIPVLTGVGFPMIELLRLVDGVVPNFAGIKYTHSNLMDFFACMVYDSGRYDILWGTDEALLPAMALGCKGAVGSTYNYLGPVFKTLIEQFESGDIPGARKTQQQANEIIYLLHRYGGIRVGKAFMKYIGLDCGDFRKPLDPFDEYLYREFSRELKTLGVDHLMSLIPSKPIV